jgi:ankyrin repeat protein
LGEHRTDFLLPVVKRLSSKKVMEITMKLSSSLAQRCRSIAMTALVILAFTLVVNPTYATEGGLFEAASDGNVERVRELINAGEDVNQATNGWSPLQIAVDKGRDDVVQLLIEHGANPDTGDNRGTTLLRGAIRKRDRALIVKYLLEGGADVNARDDNGSTALFDAVLARDDAIFDLLLEHGADVNLTGYRDTSVLMSATMNNRNERMVKLLARGANINAINIDGQTALFKAVGLLQWPDPETVRILLNGGATVNVKDHFGKYPLAIARKDLKKFLKSEKSVMKMAKRGQLFETPERIQEIKSDYQQIVTLLENAAANELNQVEK